MYIHVCTVCTMYVKNVLSLFVNTVLKHGFCKNSVCNTMYMYMYHFIITFMNMTITNMLKNFTDWGAFMLDNYFSITILRFTVYTSPNKDSVSVYTETESYQPAGQSPHRKRLLWHCLKLTCVGRLKLGTKIPWTTIMTSAKVSDLMLKKSLSFDDCSWFQSPLTAYADAHVLTLTYFLS